jgi:hypothetical protein
MSKSVALVSVHYYPDYQGRNARQIARLKKRIDISRHVGVLNGSRDLTRDHASDSAVQWVTHDNDGMEFGAYQRGLDTLLASSSPDWVIFLNDTIGTHDLLPGVGLRKLADQIEHRVPDVPVLTGYVGLFERSMEMGGWRGCRCVRSHFFAMNRAALSALNDELRLRSTDELITASVVEDTFFSPAMSPSMRSRLTTHLLRPELQHRWYRAARLSPENCESLARKARSCLHEFCVTFRLEQTPALVVDLSPNGARESVFERLETEIYFLTTHGSLRIAK